MLHECAVVCFSPTGTLYVAILLSALETLRQQGFLANMALTSFCEMKTTIRTVRLKEPTALTQITVQVGFLFGPIADSEVHIKSQGNARQGTPVAQWYMCMQYMPFHYVGGMHAHPHCVLWSWEVEIAVCGSVS